MVLQVHALLRQCLQHGSISALARAVDMMERLLPRLQSQHIRHLGVHAGSAQRPPEGDDQRPSVIDAQLFLGRLLGQGEEVLPDRGAGDGHLLRVLVVLAAGFKAYHDPPGVRLQQLRGQSRHGVGLMDRRGDAHFGGGLHGGIAGVAAGADHRVRSKLLQNSPGLCRGADHIVEGHQIVLDLRRLEGAVKAGDVNGTEFVSRLGDQVLFQATLRPHEQYFDLRVLLRHQLRHGNSRVHMARRAAAGEDHPVNALFHQQRPFPKRCQNRPKRQVFTLPKAIKKTVRKDVRGKPKKGVLRH